jgi:hypothetical protein
MAMVGSRDPERIEKAIEAFVRRPVGFLDEVKPG